MNITPHGTTDDMKAFQLLNEVADERPVSQRELAQKLGIALGLVNSYIKNFVAKGYIRIRNYPHNRYGYLLTPQGITEKARLAYQHVNYFTSLYTITREEYRRLFQSLSKSKISAVCFCGVDEVAEIAWLSLQESGIGLVRVFDNARAGSEFMGIPVETLNSVASGDRLIITSVKRRWELFSSLCEQGVDATQIFIPASELTEESRNAA
jgi:DNA-binding MarR family transcriptional regulator/virulence-associated protein VagC